VGAHKRESVKRSPAIWRFQRMMMCCRLHHTYLWVVCLNDSSIQHRIPHRSSSSLSLSLSLSLCRILKRNNHTFHPLSPHNKNSIHMAQTKSSPSHTVFSNHTLNKFFNFLHHHGPGFCVNSTNIQILVEPCDFFNQLKVSSLC
jgi:hypothetical protein